MMNPNNQQSYFNPNNKQIIEAIVKDDFESLGEIVLSGEPEMIDQKFGFDNKYLPRFLSSAPPIISVAAYFNAIECVRFLIDNGANLKKTDIIERPLIHFAFASCSMEMVRLIVDAGENDLQVKDSNGNQPIHVACEFGFFDGVKYIYLKLHKTPLHHLH